MIVDVTEGSAADTAVTIVKSIVPGNAGQAGMIGTSKIAPSAGAKTVVVSKFAHPWLLIAVRANVSVKLLVLVIPCV